VSSAGTTAFRIYVKTALERMKESLAALRARPDKLLVSAERGATKLTYVHKDTTEKVWSQGGYVSAYEAVLKSKIQETEREIAATEEEIDFLTQKIKTWKPEPLPGTK
jgi:hypothetical protein